MTRLESRVGEACREAAETVRREAIRDLVLDPAQRAMRVQGAGRGRGSLFGPLAAAASVVVIAVGALVVVPRLGSTPHHAAKTRHKAVRMPPALAALPRYTVLNIDGSYLQVVATATGRVVSTVPHPPNQAFATMAGTANDRTFFVAADLNPQTSCQTYFYRFSLNADGQPSVLTRLPVAHLAGLPTALAATADGSRVAFSVVQCAAGPARILPNSHVIGAIGVIDLANGKITKKWSYTLGEDYTTDLSMSADGSMLGYSNYFGAKLAGRMLATRSPAGLDGRYSRIVVRQPTNSAISTDGRLLYAVTGTKPQILAAYDTNGRRVKVLHRWPAEAQLGPLFADPGGGYVLLPVQASRPRMRTVRVTRSGRPCLVIRVHAKIECKNVTFSPTRFVSVNLTTGAATVLPISGRLFTSVSWGMVAW